MEDKDLQLEALKKAQMDRLPDWVAKLDERIEALENNKTDTDTDIKTLDGNIRFLFKIVIWATSLLLIIAGVILFPYLRSLLTDLYDLLWNKADRSKLLTDLSLLSIYIAIPSWFIRQVWNFFKKPKA